MGIRISRDHDWFAPLKVNFGVARATVRAHRDGLEVALEAVEDLRSQAKRLRNVNDPEVKAMMAMDLLRAHVRVAERLQYRKISEAWLESLLLNLEHEPSTNVVPFPERRYVNY